MSNNRRISFDLPTDQDGTVIEVKVRYSDGKDGADRRGYWVNINPVKVEGVFRTVEAYSGVKVFIESANRFGAKKLATLASSVKHQTLTGHTDDRWPRIARQVASDKGLRITQWDGAKTPETLTL